MPLTDFQKDHYKLYADFRVPTGSLEIRTGVGSGSIALSASLAPNTPYYLVCYGAHGCFGFGSSLTFTNGVGANQGIPITEGSPFAFVTPFTSSVNNLRVASQTVSASFILYGGAPGLSY